MNLVSEVLKRKHVTLIILGWSVFIFSVLCNFATYNQFKFNAVFNADVCGIPSLFNDIFREGGNIKDWYLSAAPCLFPDVFLYYFFSEIIRLDFVTIMFFYGLVQASVIVYLSSYIYKKTVPESYKEYVWLVPIFYSFIFLESFYFTQHEFFAFLILTFGYHAGAFVNTLISTSIFISDIKNSWKYFLLFLLSFLFTFSDILYIVMFVGPMLGINIVLHRYKGIKFALLSTFSVLLGCILAFYVYNYVKQTLLFNYIEPNRMYDFQNIQPSFDVFYEQMTTYIALPGFRSIQILFAFIAPIVCFAVLMVRRRSMDMPFKFLLWFYVLFSAMVFAAPIVNGNYTAWDTIRYNVSAIFFSMIILALFVGFIYSRLTQFPWVRTMLLYALPVFLLILISWKFSPTALKNYFSYYPNQVRELDSVSRIYNLKNGISNYWNAKSSSVFSKNKLKVLSMHKAVHIYEMGSNLKWFYNHEFDFIIADKLDSVRIQQLFIIKDTIKTTNFTILKVNKFIFPTGTYEPLTIDTLN
jgi:hypothetical protein